LGGLRNESRTAIKLKIDGGLLFYGSHPRLHLEVGKPKHFGQIGSVFTNVAFHFRESHFYNGPGVFQRQK
jgi:hypothetical protein